MAHHMANETSALRGEPQPSRVAEDDYRSFSAALGASARGRAFLHEYARRNRHADTEVVLTALDRLESVARGQKTAPEAERIRQDLRALLGTIRSARPQIDQTPGAIKAATLSALIEFVQARIEALVQPMNAPLASVPEPEQPELPMPQPGTAVQRTLALVEAIGPQPVPPRHVAPAVRNFDPDSMPIELPRSTRTIPEVNFIDSLFNAIDAKNKAESKQESKTVADAATSEAEIAAAPVVALLPIEAPAFTAATLPMEMPSPVAAAPLANVEDVATIATADTVARSDATAAKINASAAAIDEIVAAAQAAMADAVIAEAGQAEASVGETAIVQTAIVQEAPADTEFVQTTFVETSFVETTFAEAVTAETAIADTELAAAEFVETTFPEAATATDIQPAEATAAIAPAALAPVVTPAADPSMQAMDNALAEIMALSDEERLALFT